MKETQIESMTEKNLEQLVHDSETIPESIPDRALSSKTHPGSVKVDTDRIDAVLDMVGELVVLKSQLMNETQPYQSNLKLNSLVSLIESSIRALQDKALGMRMTPLRTLFMKTQRIVRDLSVKLLKPIEFHMSGDSTEIDRTMVELLSDPLLHLARNALDHGIEKAEIRRSIGKSEKGTIRLSAQQVGGRINIEISDDGAGLDWEKIRKKAFDLGLIPNSQSVDSIQPEESYQLIFERGFSTTESVGDLSGRGVGMSIVKANVEKLKGTITVESKIGIGTSFLISIPLTTSITDGMEIKSSGHPYIIPIEVIRELVNIEDEQVTEMHSGQEVLNIRGKVLPVVDLDDILAGSQPMTGSKSADLTAKTIVVVETTKGLLAIRVQAVLGQVQVVLKSLGEYFKSSFGIAGAAILGNGKVALVLDVDHFSLEKATFE